MSPKKMLGSHVKQLLSGVSDHGNAHLSEVETDLAQTALLLGEAIEKLGVSFLSLHSAVLKEQDEINLIIDTGLIPPESIGRIRAIQAEISQHVNAAVTSLQFQDLTSQLISRTLERCNGLREVLTTLGVVGNDISHDAPSDDIESLLKETILRLEKQSIDLQNLLRKAVHQKHLDSGDIELF
ncbi:chemotaxis protein [Undibacterium oligocarboniphilum]|uniref:Chemotaxis protein n=1 Tax=Undibacterium oligocarboniphilum TaxID=666702 RepID=A0A850QCV2_9BURK|nr:chemotaxis protein [Undibacterium oligocarboniphilum]MBC3868696.1 chemotaxis protein [Undibacterium oligocarboniphilum]NVO76677.1 chemotaxis protein [Undibacterium oligocarboniphilum]